MINLDLTELAAVLQCDPGQDWMLSGLCGQTDPELFYPEKGGSTNDAIRVCRSCPVMNECLEFAITRGERFGVWGGLTERQRRRIETQRYGRIRYAVGYADPAGPNSMIRRCPDRDCQWEGRALGLSAHRQRVHGYVKATA